MKQWVAQHDTASFVFLTFACSWPLWFASGVLGRSPLHAPDYPWLIAQIGVFAPAFAGMVVGHCVDADGSRRFLSTLACVYTPAVVLGAAVAGRGYGSFIDLGPAWNGALISLALWSSWWFGHAHHRFVAWPGHTVRRAVTASWSAGAIVVTSAVFGACWAMAGDGGGRSTIAPMPVRELTLGGVASALALNLVFGGALGEEPGWRGAWLPRLLKRRSPLVASVIISAWWAAWHAPIDLAQGLAVTGVGALVVRQAWTLPMTVLFTWVTVRAGGSLLPALALHAAINAWPDFALADPLRYERALGLFFIAMALFALLIATHERWTRYFTR